MELLLTNDNNNLLVLNNIVDLDNLPDSNILAEDIIENLETGLNSSQEIMETLSEELN